LNELKPKQLSPLKNQSSPKKQNNSGGISPTTSITERRKVKAHPSRLLEGRVLTYGGSIAFLTASIEDAVAGMTAPVFSLRKAEKIKLRKKGGITISLLKIETKGDFDKEIPKFQEALTPMFSLFLIY
jgi:hypothetical protein